MVASIVLKVILAIVVILAIDYFMGTTFTTDILSIIEQWVTNYLWNKATPW